MLAFICTNCIHVFYLTTQMIIDKKDFICKNCKYKQHQCSACGLLGSSDLSSGAEVDINSLFDYVTLAFEFIFLNEETAKGITETV